MVCAMPFDITPEAASVFAGGLAGVMQVAEGPTDEQAQVMRALAAHVLQVDPGSEAAVLTPDEVASALPDRVQRRIFLHMAIILELCRHPADEQQLRRVDAYGEALGVGAPELEAVRVEAHRAAEEATAYFIRVYDKYLPELSERSLAHAAPPDTDLWSRLQRLDELPEGTLGWAYLDFHRRHGFKVPSPETPEPAYYVSHDMNHVIAGYEPTGPGEISLGVFKLSMNDSDANWMAAMVNLLIHEVGLIKHGTTTQFVPFGGAPYPGPDGQFGALSLPGAPDLLAEAFERGAATASDFSRADHLALAPVPLAEVRERYHVVPLRHSMMPFDDTALWPRSH
jgi:hypothetical protein